MGSRQPVQTELWTSAPESHGKRIMLLSIATPAGISIGKAVRCGSEAEGRIKRRFLVGAKLKSGEERNKTTTTTS